MDTHANGREAPQTTQPRSIQPIHLNTPGYLENHPPEPVAMFSQWMDPQSNEQNVHVGEDKENVGSSLGFTHHATPSVTVGENSERKRKRKRKRKKDESTVLAEKENTTITAEPAPAIPQPTKPSPRMRATKSKPTVNRKRKAGSGAPGEAEEAAPAPAAATGSNSKGPASTAPPSAAAGSVGDAKIASTTANATAAATNTGTPPAIGPTMGFFAHPPPIQRIPSPPPLAPGELLFMPPISTTSFYGSDLRNHEPTDPYQTRPYESTFFFPTFAADYNLPVEDPNSRHVSDAFLYNYVRAFPPFPRPLHSATIYPTDSQSPTAVSAAETLIDWGEWGTGYEGEAQETLEFEPVSLFSSEPQGPQHLPPITTITEDGMDELLRPMTPDSEVEENGEGEGSGEEEGNGEAGWIYTLPEFRQFTGTDTSGLMYQIHPFHYHARAAYAGLTGVSIGYAELENYQTLTSELRAALQIQNQLNKASGHERAIRMDNILAQEEFEKAQGWPDRAVSGRGNDGMSRRSAAALSAASLVVTAPSMGGEYGMDLVGLVRAEGRRI
ncbi:hypothetical protein DFH27DRAFT_657242 [Peziza echinospora]|nr:hypothetical protein DFH27DRAFT_657242 [Peziza echinospora]